MGETSGSAQDDKVSPMTALNFEFVLYRTNYCYSRKRVK